MATLLDGIQTNRFLVIGRVGMDLSPDPAGTRTEDARTMVAGLGGSPANIAAGLSKFGATTALVTTVSDDSVGQFCVNQLRDYGVGTDYVRTIGGEFRTSLAVYESRVTDHQSVIYRNGAADFEMTTDDIDRIDFSAFGALVAAGTGVSAEPSRSATFHAMERAKAAGLPVIFDVDYRPYSWPSADVAAEVLSRAGRLCDMIVGNDEEFGFMAGSFDKGLSMARDLAQAGAGVVVYKMGEKGAITFSDGQEERTGIYQVDALKPTGAGDSFMAGLLSGLARKMPVQDAVLRGSACAAIVVGRPGCAPAMPDEPDLAEFLARHPGPSGI